MKHKTSQHGVATVIALQGNLMGGPDAATLNNKLHELVESGTKQVVLDLSDVQIVNSSGLGMLIAGVTTMKNAGGSLKLAGASEKILSIIKVTKLQSVFDMHATVKAAVESFKK